MSGWSCVQFLVWLSFLFNTDSSQLFITYTDADYGGNPDNGCATGGYAVVIGSGAPS